MAVGLVMFICEVPALKVRFVVVEVFQAVPAADRATVLLPSVMVLTLELVEERLMPVTLKFAVSNVPCVTVSVLVPIFNASPSVSVMPEPLTVTPLNALPAVISVPVSVIVIVPT